MKKLVIYHVNISNRGRGSVMSYLPESNNYMFLYTSDKVQRTKLLKEEENNNISEKYGISKINGDAYYYEFFGMIYNKKAVEKVLKEELGLDIRDFEIIESPLYPPEY